MAPAEAFGWGSCALDLEREVVLSLERGGFDECVEQFLFGYLPVDVDIAGESGALGQSQVEGEAALEQLAAGRGFVESREKSIKGDALSVAIEACDVSGSAREESLLERLPKRGSVAVPHAARSDRRRSMKVRTRAGRPAAAARRRRGVVRPRSSAWRTASSICSGWVPASSESKMVRSGLVARTPATWRISFGAGGSESVWN